MSIDAKRWKSSRVQLRESLGRLFLEIDRIERYIIYSSFDNSDST
jgi:hypothetical protein